MSSHNQKVVAGMLLLILGGTLLVTSVVFTLVELVNGKYDQLYNFPIPLSTLVHEKTAGTFTVPSRSVLSLWLRVPDCRIEDNDFQLTIKIINDKSQDTAVWKNTFSSSMIHNNDAEGQYYLLGMHYFNKNFSGKINYYEKGTWVAPYNGSLVIRKPKVFFMPVRMMMIITFAIMLSMLGIAVLARRNHTM